MEKHRAHSTSERQEIAFKIAEIVAERTPTRCECVSRGRICPGYAYARGVACSDLQDYPDDPEGDDVCAYRLFYLAHAVGQTRHQPRACREIRAIVSEEIRYLTMSGSFYRAEIEQLEQLSEALA